jgi:hypothetical protein
MQEHMLGNMRDHLVTLNEIIGNVADGEYDAAAKFVEQKLGMSSLGLHGAAHMAPFMPQPMQDIGTSMHYPASRLAIVLQDGHDAQCQPRHPRGYGNLHRLPFRLPNTLSGPSAFRVGRSDIE